MSLYDGVDIDGVPMQSNSTEGTDITKLCEFIYNFINIVLYFCYVDWSEFQYFLTFFSTQSCVEDRSTQCNAIHFSFRMIAKN